jgi:hypothetical protein
MSLADSSKFKISLLSVAELEYMLLNSWKLIGKELDQLGLGLSGDLREFVLGREVEMLPKMSSQNFFGSRFTGPQILVETQGERWLGGVGYQRHDTFVQISLIGKQHWQKSFH